MRFLLTVNILWSILFQVTKETNMTYSIPLMSILKFRVCCFAAIFFLFLNSLIAAQRIATSKNLFRLFGPPYFFVAPIPREDVSHGFWVSRNNDNYLAYMQIADFNQFLLHLSLDALYSFKDNVFNCNLIKTMSTSFKSLTMVVLDNCLIFVK